LKMRINQKGMSMMEVIVSLLMVTLIMFAAIAFMTSSYQTTKNNQEKEFATQKAMSILDELKSFVEDNAPGGLVLDDFDENSPTPLLTVQTGITDPLNAVSGNTTYPYATGCTDCSGYLYERQITVSPLGEDDNRLVNVKVFSFREKKKRLVAEVASVLRTIAPAYAPTQVYDVYLLAIENIPGWWVYMSNIVPFVQSTLQDLQARNPGLEFRTHWIRKLSYGRDFQYTPYFNSAADTTTDINLAYFYPGLLPASDLGNYASRPVDFYYLPALIRARINVDGTISNGYNAGANPLPYALADNYNNSMRFPDEQAYFQSRASSTPPLEDPDEPTYRLLIEDMFQNPANYRNSIFINLHGEMFPFPPVRNYSDAAKDPDTFTWAQGAPRAVTHPEQLRYTNAQDLKLRVYGYRANPGCGAGVCSGQNPWLSQIKVILKNITWTPNAGNQEVIAFEGGTDQDGVAGADLYTQNLTPLTAPSGNRMYYTAGTLGADTVIDLFNTPVTTPLVSGSGGFASTWRLYGFDYVPSPLEDLVSAGAPVPFSVRHLADTVDNRPKNSARWVLKIPSAQLPTNGMVTIETRIGNDPSDGVLYPTPNAPQNLSKTYAWRGTDTWIFGDGTFATPPHLPLTERFQTIGDPRHLPYADLKQVYTPTTLPLGSAFNRYFDDFHSAGGNLGDGANEWIGWQSTATSPNGIKNLPSVNNNADDGWDVTEAGDPGPQGMLEIDVNRIFEMFRSALLRTHSIYTTLSGFSYAYLGLGNEMGYDGANGFPLGIPISSKPFTGTGGTIHHDMSIFSVPDDPTNATFHFKYIKRFNNTWFAKYWIGELFPDDVYSTQWNVNASDGFSRGNLDTGVLSTNFIRVPRATVPTALLQTGTVFVPTGRSPEEEGCSAFFNIGGSTTAFHHQWSVGAAGTADLASDPGGDEGDLTADGIEVGNKYNLPLPTTTQISRPFQISSNQEGRAPDHFGFAGYDMPYVNGGNVSGVKPAVPGGTPSATFYNHELGGNYLGSALVTLRETVSGTDTGAIYAAVNGIDKTGGAGTVFIGKWSVLSLVHSFFKGGLGNSPTRIRELPRVFISPFASTDLNNPSSLDVDWVMSWKRWDSQDYTDDAAYDTFVEDTNTSHVVMYSEDNGANWLYAADNSTAIAGIRPVSVGVWAQQNAAPATTNFSYTWAGIGSLAEGSYLLRVEAYRDAFPLHYSYHQRRIFIKR
jgi:type II secretory pathway pseudopilin PulG